MKSYKFIIFPIFLFGYCFAFSQVNNIAYLSLPDNRSISIPARWYTADESKVQQMKNQTTGSSSGLLYMLFPTKIQSLQKGYPFITIGFTYQGSQIMNNYTFREYVKIQKEQLSGLLKTKLNEIVPQQFDDITFSDIIVDENKKMVIFTTEAGVPNYGQVVSYQGMVKSKTGIIRISFASLKKDINKYLPAFKIIVKSFK
jgi:hypothetical protein